MFRNACWLVIAVAVSLTATAQDVVLWTGGIGIQERESAPTEGTRLEFFIEAGNFLANVNVVVTDADGRELVNTVTAGPWLFLDLPPGRYRVVATTAAGTLQSGVIDVDASQRRFGLVFPRE